MAKTLVAYFSATGTTARIAEKVAAATGGELFRIEPEHLYSSADLNWQDNASRSTIEMNDESCRPKIARKVADMGSCDTVFIGFPIWWHVEPRIIDTFLESYDFAGKTVVPFATSGGSGMGEAPHRMQNNATGAHVQAGRRFNADASQAEMKTWIAGLGL